jgi:hypothetical protein
MYIGDIVIHIGEDLDDDRIHSLERDLAEEDGIVSACMHERTRHLMVVDFDPAVVKPSSIVYSVRGRGLNAKMVGL